MGKPFTLLDKMKTSVQSIVAWVLVPVAFSVFVKATYRLVGARLITDFFPTPVFWTTSILIFLIIGLVSFRASNARRKVALAAVYAALMFLVLAIIKIAVSCSSGDCI